MSPGWGPSQSTPTNINFFMGRMIYCIFTLLISQVITSLNAQSPDAAVMFEFKKTLMSPNSVFWSNPDPCLWEGVQCINNRVKRIQIGEKGLQGTLPPSLIQLTELQVFEVMRNHLTGPLPKFPSSVQTLLLNENQFSEVPIDFFKGMAALEAVFLDNNPLKPWAIPETLKDAVTLKTFSAISANVIGPIPNFFGPPTGLASLTTLHLSFNPLEGGLPAEFAGSSIQSLWVNGLHNESKLGGPLDVVSKMTFLVDVWLQGNKFTGRIPNVSLLTALEDFNVRDNLLTGPVPESLVNSPTLKKVTLSNNYLQGKMPKFRDGVTVDNIGVTQYCTNVPGVDCDPRVNTFLKIAEPLNYPAIFAENWVGNDPCVWNGVICDVVTKNVTEINFQNKGLVGTIAPEFSQFPSLQRLYLNNNTLIGTIPEVFAELPNLVFLDVSFNDVSGLLPKFRPEVVVKHDGTRIGI